MLEHVGDQWSLLIVRDAMMGMTRFDEFRASLGISPNILSRRLKQLVASGILERRVSQDPPVRVDYALTELGEAFRPLLLFLNAFGAQHFPGTGESVKVVHRATAQATDLRIVDRMSDLDVSWADFTLARTGSRQRAAKSSKVRA